jgi:hypothetical protein
MIPERKQAEKIIAYEWHNTDTGHCYVDYVPRNLMDENNGYTKTPLFKREEILHIIGNDFCKIIDKEIALRVAEATKGMYPKEFVKWCIYDEELFYGNLSEELITNNYGGFKSLDELFEYWKQNIRK